MNGTNCNENERGLLPYPVILAATKGDPDAMKIVMQHYQSYIAHLSMKKIRDESGNTYYGVDEDLRENNFDKLPGFKIVTSKTGEVFCYDRCHVSGFYLAEHGLKPLTLKTYTGKSVINEKARIEKMVVVCVLL